MRSITKERNTKGFVGKKVYRDDREIDNEGFALDKENLRILKARIDAILIDETKPATSINEIKRSLQ